MPQLVECVPNFSEGRDRAVLAALEASMRGVPGAHVLDIHADASHHRSVFTVVGSFESVLRAVFAAVRTAMERIDLTSHRGEHPRIGATDVVPFVPIAGATMEDCITLARRLGQRIGEELEIPVFLYGAAAAVPARENLADVRRGGFEHAQDIAPDFGPRRVHPTAGATAVGARSLLVAYNVYLDTADVAVARSIAAAIRTRSGGLPSVRALGMLVDGVAQVSTNLLNVDQTPPATVFAAVSGEAERRGVRAVRS